MSINIPLLLLSLLAWLVWPFAIGRSGARKWRFAFPLLLGLILLIPAFFYALLGLMPWRM
jgi:hypothetical protein